MLSDSSEEVNHDSTGVYDSMVTALKICPAIKASLYFFLHCNLQRKKVTPLICSKLQLQAKTSPKQKCF